MDLATQLRMLLAYNEWADRRILDAASGLSEDQLDQATLEGAPSIRHVLGHALATQLMWHGNWTGATRTRAELEAPAAFSFSALREGYEASHAALRDYAEVLDDAEADRNEQWWKDFGYEQRAPLGQMLVQVVNHGTQHRAEAALLLTALGRSPGDLDYLVYLQQATAHGA